MRHATPSDAVRARWARVTGHPFAIAVAVVTAAAASVSAQSTSNDPRVGLSGGHFVEAAEAISNLQLDSHTPKPAGFFNPGGVGTGFMSQLAFANSDLAFTGHYVFQGNFNGMQIWDVSDPSHPTLAGSFVCPGGQGDPSVYGHLLFMSVEETRGRVDCGSEGVQDSVSTARFRGVRIFDISDIAHPKQIADVQTCRGSHTHTLVPDPKDPNILYVYVQGTAQVRPAAELAGCSSLRPEQDSSTALFRIEIIRVPLDHPEEAKVVNGPRIFAVGAKINGLAAATTDPLHTNRRDPMYHATSETNMCHDITAYPAIGLAAGACSGNGILLDIKNPLDPRRIGEVSDPNMSYWHSATFNNDGTKVMFTDEWGGGVAPKCLASDPKNWGADAIFNLTPTHELQFAGYYKLPAAQSEVENCVAHNGSLVPVPGRDILVQAWYQGGLSVYDFTDPAHPQEIASFDRGPVDSSRLIVGGYWSAYWYDGHIYGSEIARGLDILELKPSQYLTQNEIDAAKLVKFTTSNPSDQQKLTWPASFVVARAYVDQLQRDNGLTSDQLSRITSDLDAAEHLEGAKQQAALKKLARAVEVDAKGSSDPRRVHLLEGELKELQTAKT